MCWLRHRDNLAGPHLAALVADARERRDRRLLRLLGQDEVLWERSNPCFETDDSTRWRRWAAEDQAMLLRPLLLDFNPAEPGRPAP